MRVKYLTVGLLALTLGLASAIGRAAEDAAAPFLGKWAITLQNVPGTFNACWLNVFRKPDGSLGGQLLWRYGSVVPVKSVKIENGELQVVRPEYDDKTKKNVDCTYAIKVANGKLDGSVKYPDGKTYTFSGVPSIEKVDVSGVWNLDLLERASRIEKRKLTLKQENDKITGTFEGDGLSVPIQNAKLAATKLTFTYEWGQGRVIPFQGEVAGDKISGTARVQFTGERQRKAGETIALFNGKDLTGWHAREPKEVPPKWEIKDGYMSPLKDASDIVSDQKFEDFKLHVEFCLPEKGGNSGVYPRGRYEVQCLDDYGKGLDPHGCGAIYSRISPTQNVSKPVGEWQTMDITLLGRWITVSLNGVTIVDNQHIDGITGGALDADENAPGPIMPQAHGQAVRFRKVDVTPLLK
jgi:hypothetical protein